MIKMAYTSVDEHEVTVHFSSHSINHRKEALSFLKEKIQGFTKPGEL